MRNQENVSFRVDKKALQKFIEQYVCEYRRLVEKSYLELKDLFSLYKDYPYHVIAYLAPRKTLLEYQPNAPRFIVQVKTVEELPKIDIKTKRYIGAFRNDYLLRIMKKTKRFAREDVLNIIADYEAHEESQKELAEYYERQFAEYVDEYIRYTVNRYDSYISSAYDVKEETISKHRDEIYDVVKIIDNSRGYVGEALLKAHCSALFLVFDEVTQDMESSLFLAMHGKYVPANALLRRVLEMIMTAMYFDLEIRKCKSGTKTYEDLCRKRDLWLEKSRKGSLSFTSEYGVLGRLIDPDTDYIARKVLEEIKPVSQRTFREYVKGIYGDLCKFVHYGGSGLVNSFSLEFAKFDEKKFKEWVSRLRQVFDACNITLAVKFPEVWENYEELQGKLEPFEQVHMLTPEQEKVLKDLASEQA